ncbi:MAG: hypothetical protein KGI19_09900 [Thaumarchaeota archaeon]|nr:hypothetical protein [Nitrososphaerota archaeon]
MLKQENRKKITAITVSAIALLVGAIVLSPMIQAQISPDSTDKRPFGQFSKYLPVRHPPAILLSDMYGNDSASIGDANKATGLSAKVATSLPSDLELKKIKTNVESNDGPMKMVTLIYAPKQISFDSKSTMDDVLNANGVIALYMTDLSTADKAKWMDDYIASTPNAHATTIQGQKAVGINGIPENGMKSQVIYYDGNTKVILFSVGFSESELTQMSESMK